MLSVHPNKSKSFFNSMKRPNKAINFEMFIHLTNIILWPQKENMLLKFTDFYYEYIFKLRILYQQNLTSNICQNFWVSRQQLFFSSYCSSKKKYKNENRKHFVLAEKPNWLGSGQSYEFKMHSSIRCLFHDT